MRSQAALPQRRSQAVCTVMLIGTCRSQGIMLKPRFTRGTHTFDFPILLCVDYCNWKVLLAAYVVPPLTIYVARRHVIRPIRRWHRTREARPFLCSDRASVALAEAVNHALAEGSDMPCLLPTGHRQVLLNDYPTGLRPASTCSRCCV